MKPLVLFGTGELADLAYYYFTKKGDRNVVAFVVDENCLREDRFHGLPVLPFERVERSHPPEAFEVFVALGSSNVNRLRAQKYREARRKGYALATFISPDARVHTGQIGDNCFIMDDNSIHPFVSIGSNVIFSNDNHVGHHSVIDDHCFVTSNVVVGGGARIGEGSFLGMNATIRDHVSVGRYNLVGAGALIMWDTGEDEIFAVPGTAPRTVTSARVGRL